MMNDVRLWGTESVIESGWRLVPLPLAQRKITEELNCDAKQFTDFYVLLASVCLCV
jgi:hypothetical protein